MGSEDSKRVIYMPKRFIGRQSDQASRSLLKADLDTVAFKVNEEHGPNFEFILEEPNPHAGSRESDLTAPRQKDALFLWNFFLIKLPSDHAPRFLLSTPEWKCGRYVKSLDPIIGIRALCLNVTRGLDAPAPPRVSPTLG